MGRLGRARWAMGLVGALLLAGAPPAPAWGNGCATCNPGYPYYGAHDAIANASLAWLKELAPARAAWVEHWFISFGGDSGASFNAANTKPTKNDNWLAYTDDPDTALQDWVNHLYMVHPRAGSEERGAPGRVAQLQAWVVENLTVARQKGLPAGVAWEHNAAHLAGLMAHYVGDMSQFGHTDDTRRDHSHPKDDPLGRTYHGYYESVTWNSRGLAALDAALRSNPQALDAVEDPAGEVEKLARWVNARDGASVSYTDADGSKVTVGKDYAWALDRFVAQYDARTSRLGMRGYDNALWDFTIANQGASVHLLAKLLADADRRAEAALGKPPVAVIAPLEPAECAAGRANVALDGSGSYDPEGAQLSYHWSAPGMTLDNATSPKASGSFPLGTTRATLNVSDGALTGEAGADVRVVDSFAPTTKAQLSGTAGSQGWWRSSVDAALEASDACGVKATRASLDGALFEEGSSVRITGDGSHEMRFYSTDLGGNAEPIQALAVRVDTVAPATAATLSGVEGRNGWWRSPVDVSLACSDATSGCNGTFHALDGGPEEPGPGALVAAEGSHSLGYRSEDIAGNAEPARALAVGIDTRPPASAAGLDGLRGDGGWWRSAVTLSLGCSDATSGCAATTLTLDGARALYREPLPVAGDGAHAASFASEDLAGNVEPEQALALRIDATPPATSAAFAGLQGNAGWWRSWVILSLACADAASGCAGTSSAVDGAAPQPYGAPLLLAGDGLHAVAYSSRDLAGNSEDLLPASVAIDTTPPATHASLAGLDGRAGWWRSAVSVALRGEDAASGVASTSAAADGAPFQPGTGLVVEGDGLHGLRFFSEDVAGNAEPAASLPVPIDATPPQVAIADPAPGGAYVNDLRVPLDRELPLTLVVGNKTVRAAASDATSGVDFVLFLVDGAVRAVDAQAPYEFVWEAGAEALGNHTVEARAFDVAGNEQGASLTITTLPTTPEGLLASARCAAPLPAELCARLPALALPPGGP